MKRIALFVAIAFTTAASVRAQIPDPGDPVCAYCEVDLKSQQPHKPGCPYYSEPANEMSTKESWTPNFNSIEYKYGNGVMCEQCGRTNGHNSDCLIGKTQRLIRDYWAKSKTPESNKFLIKTYEEISDCSLNKGVRPVRRKRHKIKQKRNLEPRFRLNALFARRPLRHPALMKHPIFLLTTRGFTNQPVRNISPNLDRTQVRA